MLKKAMLIFLGLILATGAPLFAGETIRLGVIAAKTGEAASSNGALFQAARYAVDEINGKGGVLGRKMEILEFDNQSTSLGSRKAAQTAVASEVVAVVGASWSSHSLAMAPVLQKGRHSHGFPDIHQSECYPGRGLYLPGLFHRSFPGENHEPFCPGAARGENSGGTGQCQPYLQCRPGRLFLLIVSRRPAGRFSGGVSF